MNNVSSTGIVVRPEGVTGVNLAVTNRSTCVNRVEIILKDWSTGEAVILTDKEYYISGGSVLNVNFTLVSQEYGQELNITSYEIITISANSLISSCYTYTSN